MATTRPDAPSRGDVVMVQLDPTVGHEQGGQMLALVISDNALNRSPAGLVIVAPITGTDRGVPAHIRVGPDELGLTKPSVIMLNQIWTISRRRVIRRLGSGSPATIASVDEGVKIILGLT